MSADYMLNLTHEIATRFTDHRKQTGMEPDPAHLQLRMHPDDLWKLRESPSARYISLFEPKTVHGIAIVMDSTVAVGHPVLRSTWEMVL